MNRKCSTAFSCAVIACAAFAIGASAQQTQSQPSQPAQQRSLWIAKFSCDPKAASAVAAAQRRDFDALQYSKFFSSVTTFETDSKQPQGSWSLTANELDYNGGSAAVRGLIGWGNGRASLTMEYKLTDPSGKLVWTQTIKTTPSFWGSSGDYGVVQSQRPAVDEQSQKLAEALSKFFGVAPEKKK
jgi:hypothetical protein